MFIVGLHTLLNVVLVSAYRYMNSLKECAFYHEHRQVLGDDCLVKENLFYYKMVVKCCFLLETLIHS